MSGTRKKQYSIPATVNGVSVEPSGDLLRVKGEVWVTLAPCDETDSRLWEFSLTTGRTIRTKGA